jgi:hypothetical protein
MTKQIACDMLKDLAISGRIIGVVKARVALVSNNSRLIADTRYFSDCALESLLTDYYRIDELPPGTETDGTILILDDSALPARVEPCGDFIMATGPISALERATTDKRYTLFGNQGLLYRYLLAVLEKYHNIFSFHANALYDPARNILTIVLGSGASGKSPVLLAGVAKGLKVFATELVHMQVTNGSCIFYKGAMIDNVRAGSIIFDFPELTRILDFRPPQSKDPWAVKLPLDLSPMGVESDILENPLIRILAPRTESGRQDPIIQPIEPGKELVRILFDNASEKIAEPFTIYGSLPVVGFDNGCRASHRFAAINTMIKDAKLLSAQVVVAQPRHFIEVL